MSSLIEQSRSLAAGFETEHVALRSLSMVWLRVYNNSMSGSHNRHKSAPHRVKNDGASLTEETDRRMASRKQWQRGGQVSRWVDEPLVPVHSRRTGESDY
ncbi:hypothetical protein TNCV_2755771 [Trichonephila clavipes]|nr:hypothetical protein TNCV_2755771 [Trichonephila clavipes]